MTHICVGKLTIIGSYNGLSPGWCQAIFSTNAGILLIGHLGTNFSEILIEINTFSFKKIDLKMSSGKWQPSCLGLNVLRLMWHHTNGLPQPLCQTTSSEHFYVAVFSRSIFTFISLQILIDVLHILYFLGTRDSLNIRFAEFQWHIVMHIFARCLFYISEFFIFLSYKFCHILHFLCIRDIKHQGLLQMIDNNRHIMSLTFCSL